jgi:hypothetical protein
MERRGRVWIDCGTTIHRYYDWVISPIRNAESILLLVPARGANDALATMAAA